MHANHGNLTLVNAYHILSTLHTVDMGNLWSVIQKKSSLGGKSVEKSAWLQYKPLLGADACQTPNVPHLSPPIRNMLVMIYDCLGCLHNYNHAFCIDIKQYLKNDG